jgi:hypothetical protein
VSLPVIFTLDAKLAVPVIFIILVHLTVPIVIIILVPVTVSDDLSSLPCHLTLGALSERPWHKHLHR